MYQYHKVIGVRKMTWDGLWHVLYELEGKLTWDRVPKKEALQVAKTIS